MIKKVDKNERINHICNMAYEKFLEDGIRDFSLNNFIISINISKGQFYSYFKTKEDLIFKVVSQQSLKRLIHTTNEIFRQKTFLDKMMTFFSLYITTKEIKGSGFNKLLLDMFYLYANTKNEKIKQFNKEFYEWSYKTIDKIFETEIKKGNIKLSSKNLIKGICAVADGMYIQSSILQNYDLRSNLHLYLIETDALIRTSSAVE